MYKQNNEIQTIYQILIDDCKKKSCSECDYRDQDMCVPQEKAKSLYDAGYRKEIDVVEEIFAKLLAISTAEGACDYISSWELAAIRADYRKKERDRKNGN